MATSSPHDSDGEKRGGLTLAVGNDLLKINLYPKCPVSNSGPCVLMVSGMATETTSTNQSSIMVAVDQLQVLKMI